jgi:hypothetical protein
VAGQSVLTSTTSPTSRLSYEGPNGGWRVSHKWPLIFLYCSADTGRGACFRWFPTIGLSLAPRFSIRALHVYRAVGCGKITSGASLFDATPADLPSTSSRRGWMASPHPVRCKRSSSTGVQTALIYPTGIEIVRFCKLLLSLDSVPPRLSALAESQQHHDVHIEMVL